MALKTYNPTTPGRRGLVLVDRAGLWKGKPEKSLTEGLRNKGGRNNNGRITARRRGGGHKRRYRIIDFKRFRAIADSVGATLLADMAHIAGLVAGGAHPSPVPHS